ncbi:penicillin acylase family protein [Streptomyces sp. NPDC049577]|uniref:penicillin acylase family protein n=1 Tax=Streptomyces sp. NPDC049577 TaxID=3155153 RepID=UPI00342BB6C0
MLDAAARERPGDHEPLPAAVSAALTAAAARIAEKLGDDPARWRHDRVHRIADRHPLGTAARARGEMYPVSLAGPGAGGTAVLPLRPRR